MRKSRPHRHVGEAELSDIVIYPNRRTLVSWTIAYSIPALLGGLCALGVALLTIAFSDVVRNQTGAVIALISLFACFCPLGGWPALRLIKLLRSGEPVLVINHAGIRVRRIYAATALFLPWEEVKAVYGGPGKPYAIFSVQPHDQWFSAHLSTVERIAHHLNLLSETIALPQAVLDQSVEVILEHVQKQYKQELHLLQMKRRAETIRLSESDKREIILYASRWHLLAVAFLLGMALMPGLILIFIGPWQLSGIIASAIFLVGGVVVCPTLTWNILHTPVLIADEEGLASPCLFKDAKIKWEEIDAIYCSPGRHLLIDASPSGIVAFLTRQNKGRLVVPRYMDITISQTVFTIPQSMIPVPLDRLLEHIRGRFQDQLAYYDIETDIY